MTPLVGKNFMLYVKRTITDGAMTEDVMVPVVCATSMTITFSQDKIEATKPPNSRARSYIAGMYGYTISLDGVYMDDPDGKSVSAREFILNILAGEELQWVALDNTLPGHYYSGYLIQDTTAITSPAEGLHTYNTGLTGSGDIEVTNPYVSYVYGTPDLYVYNEDGIVIGYKETGGMPPFVD